MFPHAKRGFIQTPSVGFQNNSSADFFLHREKSKNLVSGFTLIELMVTIGIAVLIMTVTLFDFATFSDKLALSSAAQQIAVTIRQAQTYGLSVKEAKQSGSSTFLAGYGVYFETASDQTHYTLFADFNKNNRYDVGNGCGAAVTECLQQSLLKNVKATSLCAAACPPFSNASVTGLQIMFVRPSPDAIMNFFLTSGSYVSTEIVGSVVLTSPKGNTIKVKVQSTGQIAVQ